MGLEAWKGGEGEKGGGKGRREEEKEGGRKGRREGEKEGRREISTDRQTEVEWMVYF